MNDIDRGALIGARLDIEYFCGLESLDYGSPLEVAMSHDTLRLKKIMPGPVIEIFRTY